MVIIDDKPQAMPSNIQIHNYDLSTLFIETRGLICKLMSDIANKSGEANITYRQAVYYFIQLFQASRYMIKNSYKIENWTDKEQIYKNFIGKLYTGTFVPTELYSFWECLQEDIVDAGLYEEDEESEINNVKSLMSRG